MAADFTWDGSSDGDGDDLLFSTADNWSTDTVPGNSLSTRLIFGDAALSGSQVIGVDVIRLVGQIRFASDADSDYVVEDLGGRLLINASTLGGVGIENQDASLATINAPLTISGSATTQSWFANAGDLSVNGNVNLNNNTVSVTGDNDVSIGGNVSGAGSIAMNGAGTLTISGVNTYAGGVTVNSGTFVLASDTAAGVGTLTVNGGTIQASGNRTISNPLSIGAGGATVAGAGQLNLGGQVTGGALTKTGAGTLNLSSDNNSFSTLNLNAGTVAITATGGNALADTAAVNLGGGTLDPNANSETAGTLTLVAGTTSGLAFQLGAGATLTFSDLVIGAGATLNITGHGGAFNTASTDNKLFITTDLGDGFLEGLNFGAAGYRGRQLDSFEVVPVPEPTAVASAFALLGLAAWRVYARRKQSAPTLAA